MFSRLVKESTVVIVVVVVAEIYRDVRSSCEYHQFYLKAKNWKGG